ncbi:hypothetical protein niasHT_024903 [Heterodera trifolii]|uniref:Uncharacterized protein n=1 Tax=Heterodera trifolii TaxID=157864 RepID=A0ABD2JYQ3_9BILA
MLCPSEMATNALRNENSKLEEVENTVMDLNIAERQVGQITQSQNGKTGTLLRTFKHIASTSPEILAKAKHVSRTACANEAKACMDLLTMKQAQTYLQRAQDEEEPRQRQQQEEQRRRLLARQAEEERRRQEELKMRLEKLNQQRQKFVDETKDILRLPQIREEKKARVSTSRKKREGGEAEDFVNDSSDLCEYEDEELRNATKKRPEQEMSGGSEEDDATVERRQKKIKAVEKRKRDRNLDEQVPALRGNIKSKAYLSSSSSSPSPAQSGAEKSGDEEEKEREDEERKRGERKEEDEEMEERAEKGGEEEEEENEREEREEEEHEKMLEEGEEREDKGENEHEEEEEEHERRDEEEEENVHGEEEEEEEHRPRDDEDGEESEGGGERRRRRDERRKG